MSPASVLAIIVAIHNAEHWNLGAGSSRKARNYFFARAIGCAYHGHDIYNVGSPDPTWLLKSTSSGGVQSDDTTAHSTDGHFYDMITGSGGAGYSFGVSDLGVVTGQFTFAPPVPKAGAMDGASYAASDFRYKLGHITKVTTAGLTQLVETISDECGEMDGSVVMYWAHSKLIGGPGDRAGINYAFGYFQNGGKGYGNTIQHIQTTPAVFPGFVWLGWNHGGSLNTYNQGVGQTNIANSTGISKGKFGLYWQYNDGLLWDISYMFIGGYDIRITCSHFNIPVEGFTGPVSYTVTPVTGQVAPGQISALIVAPIFSGDGNLYWSSQLPAMGFAASNYAGGISQGAMSCYFLGDLTCSRWNRVGSIVTQNCGHRETIGEVISLGNNTFTINWSSVGSYTYGPQFACMAIGGPKAAVGGLQGTGFAGLPFDPGMALFVSNNQDFDTPGQISHAKWSIGGTDGVEQVNGWFGKNHNTHECHEIYSRSKVYSRATPLTDGSMLLQKEASASFDRGAVNLSFTGPGGSTAPGSGGVNSGLGSDHVLCLVLEAGVFLGDECDGTGAPPPSLFITCPSPDAVLNQGYSSFMTATNGLAPYTFSLNTGVLPTGLSINSTTGEIYGVPIATGPFTFELKVVDSTAAIALVGCTITVADEADPDVPVPIIGNVSGTYFINPNKGTRVDSYYDNNERKLPNPTIRTAFIGE